MLDEVRLGIDCGGVILKNQGTTDETQGTIFSDDHYLKSPEIEHAIECIGKIIEILGNRRVFIISKCGTKVEMKTMQWLEHHQLFQRTGFLREHVFFCHQRKQKASFCEDLCLTHYIDDHHQILMSLPDSITRPILFNPVKGAERVRYPACKMNERMIVLPSWPDVVELIKKDLEYARSARMKTFPSYNQGNYKKQQFALVSMQQKKKSHQDKKKSFGRNDQREEKLTRKDDDEDVSSSDTDSEDEMRQKRKYDYQQEKFPDNSYRPLDVPQEEQNCPPSAYYYNTPYSQQNNPAYYSYQYPQIPNYMHSQPPYYLSQSQYGPPSVPHLMSNLPLMQQVPQKEEDKKEKPKIDGHTIFRGGRKCFILPTGTFVSANVNGLAIDAYVVNLQNTMMYNLTTLDVQLIQVLGSNIQVKLYPNELYFSSGFDGQGLPVPQSKAECKPTKDELKKSDNVRHTIFQQLHDDAKYFFKRLMHSQSVHQPLPMLEPKPPPDYYYPPQMQYAEPPQRDYYEDYMYDEEMYPRERPDEYDYPPNYYSQPPPEYPPYESPPQKYMNPGRFSRGDQKMYKNSSGSPLLVAQQQFANYPQTRQSSGGYYQNTEMSRTSRTATPRFSSQQHERPSKGEKGRSKGGNYRSRESNLNVYPSQKKFLN